MVLTFKQLNLVSTLDTNNVGKNRSAIQNNTIVFLTTSNVSYYCRRGLPVGTAAAASVADLADRTHFFQSDKE